MAISLPSLGRFALLLLLVCSSTIASAQAPANDVCVDATALMLGEVYTGNTDDAGADLDAVTCGDSDPGFGVWFTFTPDIAENYRFDACNSGFDTQLALYSGSCDALTCVQGQDNVCAMQSRIDQQLEAGVTYIIYLSGLTTRRGDYELTVSVLGAPPTNDVCSDAEVLTVDVPTTGTTVAAVAETPAEAPDCQDSEAGNGVWFSFTPVNDGRFDISVCGSDFDTQLAVYTGSCDAPVCVAGGDQGGCGTGDATLLTEELTGGQNYLIYLSGFNDATGNYSVVVTEVFPQANATCIDATSLLLDVPVTGNTDEIEEDTDADAPTCGPSNAGFGVWYTFTPDVDGRYDVLSCGSDFDTELAVYTGSCGDLVCLAGVDDGGPNCNINSRGGLRLDLTGGTTYIVYLSGFNNNTGDYQLTVSNSPPPPMNDNCPDAITLEFAVSVSGNTEEAGEEDVNDVPFCGPAGPDAGVFYTFTPAVDSVYEFSTCGSAFNTEVTVLSGTCGALECVIGADDGNCGDNRAVAVARLTAGITYTVYVAGAFGATGSYDLIVQYPPPPPQNDLCETATPLTFGVPVTGNTNDALEETIDEVPFCGDAGPQTGVFYTFTPAVDSIFEISTCGSSFNTEVTVLTGQCNDLQCLIGADDGNCGNNNAVATLRLSAGTTYTIYVAGAFGATGAFDLVIQYPPPPPPNDQCITATDLSIGVPATGNTSTALIETEAEAPTCGSSGPGQGVWFTFTPEIDGFYEINSCASDLSTELALYTGVCNDLQCAGGTNTGGCGNAVLRANLIGGTTYTIYLSENFGDGGAYELVVDLFNPGDDNDFCVGAIELTLDEQVFGTTTDAERETETEVPACRGATPGFGRWYTFTAPDCANYIIDACGSGYDTDLSIFSGSCSDLTCLSGTDDGGCQSRGSAILATLDAGETYYIYIGGFTSSQGDYQLTVRQDETGVYPDNDDCVDARPVRVGEMIETTSLFATPEFNIVYVDGEECGVLEVGNGNDAGVWFSFEAPDAPVNIMLDGYDEITMALLGGSCTSLSCIEDGGGFSEMVMFDNVSLDAGETYYVYVGGAFGGNGTFMIESCTDDLTCNDYMVTPDGDDGTVTVDPMQLAFATCDLTGATLSRNSFSCADGGDPIPVTVTLPGQGSCISNVTVRGGDGAAFLDCLPSPTPLTTGDDNTFTGVLGSYSITQGCGGDSNAGPVSVTVTNAAGTVISDFDGNGEQGTYDIPVTNLEPGQYTVSLALDNNPNETCSFDVDIDGNLGATTLICSPIGTSVNVGDACTYTGSFGTYTVTPGCGDGGAGSVPVTVVDGNGVTVRNFTGGGAAGTYNVDVTNLAPGTYSVTISFENNPDETCTFDVEVTGQGGGTAELICTSVGINVEVNDDCTYTGSFGTYEITEGCEDAGPVSVVILDIDAMPVLSFETNGTPGVYPLNVSNFVPGTYSVFISIGNVPTETCTFDVEVLGATADATLVCSPVGTSVAAGNECTYTGSFGSYTITEGCSGGAGPVPVFIRDASGATVSSFTGNGDAGTFPIDVVDLAPGVYTVTITIDNIPTETCTFDVEVTGVTNDATLTCTPVGEVVSTDAACAYSGSFGTYTVTPGCSDDAGPVPVNVVDANGTTVRSFVGSGVAGTYNVDVMDLAPGVYTVLINFDNDPAQSCSFDVEVRDDLAPTLDCVQSATVVNAGQACTFTGELGRFTVADNCGDVTINETIIDGGRNTVVNQTTTRVAGTYVIDNRTLPLGTSTVTITVNDPGGLTASCAFEVEVADVTAPQLTCNPSTTINLDANGMATLDPSAFLISQSDNCGPTTVSFAALQTFGCDAIGSSVTVADAVVVTDGSGNQASCDVDVTVLDVTPPVLGCQDVTVQVGPNGEIGGFVADAAITALSDNCTDTELISVTSVGGLIDCATPGNAQITATDASGNAATCNVTITPIDNIPPVLDCPAGEPITLYLNQRGEVVYGEDLFTGQATDNCGLESVDLSDIVFTCADAGAVTTVQDAVIATDLSGNTASCSVSALVLDTLAPIIRLRTRNGVVIGNNQLNQQIDPNQYFIITDNCTEEPFVEFDREFFFTVDDIGEYQAVVTATDEFGNTSTFTYRLRVGFDEPPRFACIDRVNVTLDEECEYTVIPEQLLTGDATLIPLINFDILVMDADTSNGAFVDGCGEFTYKIEFSSFVNNEIPLSFNRCWGTIFAEDKEPPALVSTPDDVTGLLCVDLDANNLNSLPRTVSRCFRVDGSGALLPGTIDNELLAVLSPAAFDNIDEDVALIPIFTDNCADEIEVCVSDVVTAPDDGCGSTTITRTFRANEAGGCTPRNPDEQMDDQEIVTSFTITFDRPEITDITTDAIMPTVEIEACATVTSPLEFLPTEADFPVLTVPSGDSSRTFSVASPEAMCANIVATFTNSANPTQVCDFTLKFTRLYSVTDWCDPTVVQTFTQFVKIGDTTGPVFSQPSGTIDADGNLDPVLTYRTNFGDQCAAIVRLDGPGVGAIDECSGADVEISVAIYPEGDVTQSPFGAYPVLLNNGEAEFSEPLEVGEYAFVYTATDECDNRTVTTVDFIVVDGNGPTAICESGAIVALSQPGGLGILTPEDVDLGSYDDCSDQLTYQIAATDTQDAVSTNFADEVIFTCDDIGTRFVTLMVTDELENSNSCWLPVTVRLADDQAGPTCSAPSAISISCTQAAMMLPADINEATPEELNAAFGVATGAGTCGTTLTERFVDARLNECGIGSITRVFTATDAQGNESDNTCTQTINIVGIYDYQIVLPGNATINDCNDEVSAQELQFTNGACDLLVVDPGTVTRVDGNGPECYIERITYTIINTCEYDVLETGSTVIDRNLLAVDDEAPVYLTLLPGSTNTISDDVAFLSSSDNRQFTPGDDDDVELVGYATSPVRGSFTYVQDIRINDRVSPTVSAQIPADCFAGCSATVGFNFTAMDDCVVPTIQAELDPAYDQASGFNPATVPGVEVEITAGTQPGEFQLTATNVPAGDHAIRLTVTDACSNARSTIVPISVCGDQAPSPLCKTSIIAVLTDNGTGMAMSEVWATDLIASELFDCTGEEVTNFGIVRFGEGPATEDQIGTKVFCSDVNTMVPVEVYAFDNLGNRPAEFCTTFIEVQEGNGVNCSSGGNLVGTVHTPQGNAMANVAVTLTGDGEMDEMDMTDAEGTFQFTGLPLGGDYTVQATYQEAVDLQRVKVSDVVAISRAILGIAELDSAYDYLAADVDQSRTLNVLDMVAIQRVILGLDEGFPTGDTWGFVPVDIDVSSPYAQLHPTVINANNLQGNMLDADFIAFAYGDVTGEGRTALQLNVDDVDLRAGESQTLRLTAGDLAGAQGTLQFLTGVELVSATVRGAGGVNLEYLAEGLLPFLLRGDGELHLKLRAFEPTNLSAIMTISNAVTPAAGVTFSGNGGALSLQFNTASGLSNAWIGVATPNPTFDQTFVPFSLPEAQEITLLIHDITGKLVTEKKITAAAGAGQLTVTRADLGNAAGVYTYTVVSETLVVTHKLVVK